MIEMGLILLVTGTLYNDLHVISATIIICWINKWINEQMNEWINVFIFHWQFSWIFLSGVKNVITHFKDKRVKILIGMKPDNDFQQSFFKNFPQNIGFLPIHVYWSGKQVSQG